jgi:hypothetical protein
MLESVSYLAVWYWYSITCEIIFYQLAVINKLQNTYITHLLVFQHGQSDFYFCPVCQQICSLREIGIHILCRSIKLTSLQHASVKLKIASLNIYFVYKLYTTMDIEFMGSFSNITSMELVQCIFTNWSVECNVKVNHITTILQSII